PLAGGRERGRLGTPTRLPRWGPRPAGRGGVSRDKRFSPSTPGVPTARTLRGGVARTGMFADRTRHGECWEPDGDRAHDANRLSRMWQPRGVARGNGSVTTGYVAADGGIKEKVMTRRNPYLDAAL